MNLSEYQEQAAAFITYPNEAAVLYPLLALSEEVGEVSGKVAKYLRKSGPEASIELGEGLLYGHDVQQQLMLEIGDALWCLSALCEGLGFDLEEIAQINLDKLAGRMEAGTIIGEGDYR